MTGGGRPIWALEFSEEEIKSEERRPKQKVALIFGYAGTGYRGLQIDDNQKTIEGDIFRACVLAGAVSKANSDDPKKVSWVRCSRTDRNVHAGANVISAQLIVQDEDIVERINKHLPPEIRVWGYERTNKSFNAHQRCDSRVYQYWLPSYCLIPPHPKTFLAMQLAEIAEETGDAERQEHQRAAAEYWARIDADYVQPVLGKYDVAIQEAALDAIFHTRTGNIKVQGAPIADDKVVTHSAVDASATTSEPSESTEPDIMPQVEEAVKAVKEAYIAARRTFRINAARLAQFNASMAAFDGTQNFWNYTVRKTFNDSSAKRYMLSCRADQAPLVMDGIEWLPIDLHGQSFMMHQIRKMVCFATMAVRCGTPLSVIHDSFGETKLTVPKAPPTGLLLERPVFHAFNASLDRLEERQNESIRGRVDARKFKDQIEKFKREYIVAPMHRIEAREHIYQHFFTSLDSLRSPALLYFSSLGIPAITRRIADSEQLETVLAEDEDELGIEGDQ